MSPLTAGQVSLSDLRRLFYGGGSDAEYTTLLAAANAGKSAASLLSVSNRGLWVPARPDMVPRESSSASAIGTVPNDNETIVLADAATQGFGWSVVVPNDAKAASPLLASIYWCPSASVGGNTAVRWELTFMVCTPNGDLSAAGTTTTFTGANAAKTAQVQVVEAAQQVLASCSPGDFVRCYGRRLGADAADTMTATVQLLGVLLTYSAAF